jgi:hypothetical protein
MYEIHALNASAGQSIPSVLGRTFKTFAPLLLKNKVCNSIHNPNRGRWDMLEKYYGSKYDVKVGCRHGLLEALTKTRMSIQEAGVPKVLALVGEFDPHDEIAGPMEDCVESWKKGWGEGIECGY